jgi:hypothetical protein
VSDAAPPAPAPAPAPAKPAWTPPDTFADKFSRFSTKAVVYSIAAFGLVSMILLVLWLVPAVVVARSASFATAKEAVATHRSLVAEAGTPVTCARLPSKYRLGTPDGDIFRVDFEGPRGQGEAEVAVKDGKAVALRFYVGPRF